jgi:hypothetical protein
LVEKSAKKYPRNEIPEEFRSTCGTPFFKPRATSNNSAIFRTAQPTRLFAQTLAILRRINENLGKDVDFLKQPVPGGHAG